MIATIENHATVKSANEANQERAVAVIVLAFSTDPVTRWAYPDAQQFLTYFPQVVRAFGGNAFTHATGYYADDFKGAALWLPPDVHPQEEEMAALLQRSVAEERQAVFFSVMEQMGGYHPPEPHWYLPLIGVDPLHQGEGYGSALMEHALVACDREKKPAYLESTNPRNIPLYERHGFEVIGKIQEGSCPPVFPMLRKPRAAETKSN